MFFELRRYRIKCILQIYVSFNPFAVNGTHMYLLRRPSAISFILLAFIQLFSSLNKQFPGNFCYQIYGEDYVTQIVVVKIIV